MANEVKFKLAVDGAAQVSGQLAAIEQKIGSLGGAIGKLGHYGAALYALPTALNATMGELVRTADAITTLNTQLRLATGSSAQATQAYGALFDIAQKSRVSFTELGTTFAAIARSGKELGISQERLLTVTQSISQAMTIGGGSAASMQAALVQLGQGLASGTLRGEELNSIMEQTPRLAKAIADGLGVPIGRLRELGAAGELTAQQIISALEKSGPQLAKEMASATLTVGQAFTMLGNSTAKFIGEADKASGASGSLAGALKVTSGALDTVGEAIKNHETAFAVIVNGLAATATVAGVTALAVAISTRLIPAVVGLGVAMAANPGILALAGIAAAGTAIITLASAYGKSADAMKGKISAIGEEIAKIESAQAMGRGSTEFQARISKRKEELVLQRAQLAQTVANAQADQGAQLASANSRAAHTKLAKDAATDRAAFAKAGEAYLTKDQKSQATLNAEIDKTRALFEKGSISAAEYAQRINAVQASFAKAAPSVKGMSDAQKDAAKAQTEAHRVLLANAAEHTKTVDAAIEADEKAHKLTNDQIKTASTMAEQIEFETRLLTMNTEQRAQATMERELERQGIVKGTAAYDAYIVKLRKAMALKTGKEGEIKAADDLREANKKAAEEAGKYWEDALMRAFESGKGFFQSLWDTIKNTLKTQILKVSIQGVMGTLGMGAAGSAMAGGSSLTGLASTVSAISNLPSTIGSLATAVTNLPSLLGSSSMGALDIAGISMGPVGWAAMGAVAVAAIIGGNNTKSSAGTGEAGRSYDATGTSTGTYEYAKFGGMSAVADSSITMLQNSYAQAAKSLGISMAEQQFTYGGNTGHQGESPNFLYGVNGAVSYRSGETPVSNAAMQLEASRVLLAALQGSELPKFLSGAFDGLTASSATQDQITASLNNAQALKNFNSALVLMPAHFQGVADLSYAATQALIGFSGGLENLSTNLGTYYTNFYTAEEQRAQTIANINAATAGSGLDAATADRAGFRKLVESWGTAEKLATAEGQKTYAALLSVSGAFAALNPAVEAAAVAVRSAADILTERTRLQDQLDNLTMTSAQLLDKQRSALDASNQGLFDQITTLEAQKVASEAASTALQAASESLAQTLQTLVDASRGGLDTAVGNLQAAYSAEAAAITATQNRFEGISQTFRSFAESLVTAVESPAQSLERLQAQYTRLTDMARLGDANAATQAVSVGAQLKDSIVARSANSTDAALSIARLQVAALATADIADQQASIAEQSLSALTTQVSALVTLNTSVLSVAAAVDAFKSAQADYDKLQNQYLQNIALGISNSYIAGNTQGALTGVGTLVGTQGMTAEQISTALTGTMTAAQIAALTKISDVNTNGIVTAAEVAVATSVQSSAEALFAAEKANLNNNAALSNTITTGVNNAAVAVTTAAKQAETLYATLLGRPLGSYEIATLDANPNFTAAELTAMITASQEYAIRNTLGVDAQNLLIQQVNSGLGIKTNIKAFDQGTNYLPSDMVAQVHAGERIIPAADNRELMARLQSPSSNNNALVAEIRALRQEVAELRKSNSRENTAIMTQTALTADATRRMDKNGVLVYTDPAEPLTTQAAA